MSYNLFLNAPRGTILSPEETKELIEKLRQETNLYELCEIVDFTGRYDRRRGASITLAKCFNDGEFKRDEYEAFCESHRLNPSAGEQQADAAARVFLDFKWGQPICSPTMPKSIKCDMTILVYRLIVDFARRHRLVVHDPQIGADINLADPGEVPPMILGSVPATRRKLQLSYRFWLVTVTIIAILIGLALPSLFPDKFAHRHPQQDVPVQGTPPK